MTLPDGFDFASLAADYFSLGAAIISAVVIVTAGTVIIKALSRG